MKHTPTPWEYRERKPWGGPYSTTDAYIVDSKGHVVVNGCGTEGTEEAKANTAFIVQACNSYDALLEVARLAASSQGWDGNNDDRWAEFYRLAKEAIAMSRHVTTGNRKLVFNQDTPWSTRASILIEDDSPSGLAVVAGQMDAKLARDIVESFNRVSTLEDLFRHNFVDNPEERDRCKKCGLDLRDPIHTRWETTGGDKQ